MRVSRKVRSFLFTDNVGRFLEEVGFAISLERIWKALKVRDWWRQGCNDGSTQLISGLGSKSVAHVRGLISGSDERLTDKLRILYMQVMRTLSIFEQGLDMIKKMFRKINLLMEARRHWCIEETGSKVTN